MSNKARPLDNGTFIPGRIRTSFETSLRHVALRHVYPRENFLGVIMVTVGLVWHPVSRELRDEQG